MTHGDSTDRTIDGHPIDEAQIEAWAREAEVGYEVDVPAKRGRPLLGSGVARVVPVRLDPELSDALTVRAQQDNTNRSIVIRDALRAWLQTA
jgi:predicted transcriptional regulator